MLGNPGAHEHCKRIEEFRKVRDAKIDMMLEWWEKHGNALEATGSGTLNVERVKK